MTVNMGFSYPLYLHYLGYTRYGLWLVLSTVLIVAQLGNLGIGQAVSKQVAAETATDNHTGIALCVSTALAALLFSGLAVFSIITVSKHAIAMLFHVPAAETAIVVRLLPGIGLLSIYAICLDTYNSTLSGLGRLDLNSYIQLTSQTITLATTLLLLRANCDLFSLLIGSAIGYLTSHVLIFAAVRHVLGRSVISVEYVSLAQLRRTLSLSVYLMGSSMIALLVVPLNRLLLSRYVGIAALPVYDILSNGSMKLRALIETAVRALMPEVSKASATPGLSAGAYIARMNRKISRLIVVGGGILYGGALVCGGYLLHLWLGNRASSIPSLGLRLSLIGTFISLLGVPSFYILLGLGKGKEVFTANALQGLFPVVCVFACLWLTHSISVVTLIACGAAGMSAATLYLVWSKAQAVHAMMPVSPGVLVQTLDSGVA